jgi:hypothetical protein
MSGDPHPPPPPPAADPRPASPTGPGLAVAALVLTAAVGTAAGAVLWSGRPGAVRALVIAGLTCLPGFLIGRALVGGAPADPGRALTGALVAIALRTLFPLAVLAWLTTGPTAPAGPTDAPPPVDAAATLVAFYLALLATDVLLHVIARPPRDERGH